MLIPWKAMSKNHLISNNQLSKLQILYALTLGDGTLTRLTKKGSSSLSISHSEKQLDYLIYKQDLIESIGIKTMFHCRNIYLKSTGKTYRNYRFNTKSNLIIGDLNKHMYKQLPNGKQLKVIKSFNLFTTFALYILCCDDLTRYDNIYNYGSLCTESFSYLENIAIQNYLYNTYNIKTNLHTRAKDKYRIYIPSEGFTTLKKVLAPYVNLVPCMKYKFR